MPKISVIVPVYNAQAYLEACIRSILGQTWSDLELLLVDDGSTDTSPQICDTFAAQDARVRVIHQSNSGAAAARNRGIQEASGEFIAFVDSDDYIDPDMYDTMLSIALDHHCDLVICDCLKESPSKREIYTHDLEGGFYDRARMERVYFPQLLMTESMEYPVTISNWLLLIRREIIQENQIAYPVGIRFSEDLLFGAEVGYASNSLFYLKGYTPYHYRQNPTSVTHTAYRDKWPMLLDLYHRIAASFSKKTDFDFQAQVDRCLLFLVYIALGELSNSGLSRADYTAKVHEVLDQPQVCQMMRHISILKLQISWKLKLLTFLYRWRAIPLIFWTQKYRSRSHSNRSVI